jgi:hypothetical protein
MALDSSLFQQLTRTDLAAATLSLAVLFSYLVHRRRSSRRVKTTNLAGPQSYNFIVGLFPTLVRSENPGAIVEGWVREHGRVFAVPTGFGRKNVTIADVKAANHFLARDTGVYRQTAFARVFMLNLVSRLRVEVRDSVADRFHTHSSAMGFLLQKTRITVGES